MYGRSETRLTMFERASYTLRRADRNSAEIHKTYELTTAERLDGAPRVRLVGEGTLTWDLQEDVPRSIELRATLTSTTRTVTRRIPITLKYTLGAAGPPVPGPAAPAVPKPAQPAIPPPPADETTGLLRDLGSEEASRRRVALVRLAAAEKPDGKRPQVARRAQELLRDPDYFIRNQAARVLKVWGSPANVPAMIAALDDENAPVRWALIEALEATGDPRAIEVLVRLVREDRERFFASQALKRMGPRVERTVLALLAEKDDAVRTEACRILTDVGTAASLPALDVLSIDESPGLRMAADRAATSIRAR
jgi:hypothetical protein